MKNRGYGPRGGQTARKELEYHGLDGVPSYDYDGEPVKATGDEMSIIILVYLMYMTARNRSGKLLEKRLKLIPGAWNKWRSAVGFMARAMDAIFVTMPGDQLARVDMLAKHGRVDINLPKASDCGGDRMIVDTANFITIMEAAMESECKLCFKQGGECKRCKLFRALSVEAAPKTWETTSGCVYRDIAMEGVGNMTEATKI